LGEQKEKTLTRIITIADAEKSMRTRQDPADAAVKVVVKGAEATAIPGVKLPEATGASAVKVPEATTAAAAGKLPTGIEETSAAGPTASKVANVRYHLCSSFGHLGSLLFFWLSGFLGFPERCGG
jgi:hypothetical protein